MSSSLFWFLALRKVVTFWDFSVKEGSKMSCFSDENKIFLEGFQNIFKQILRRAVKKVNVRAKSGLSRLW